MQYLELISIHIIRKHSQKYSDSLIRNKIETQSKTKKPDVMKINGQTYYYTEEEGLYASFY